MRRILTPLFLLGLSACGGSPLLENPKEILSVSGSPEGFALTAEGDLWVLHREGPERLTLERYAPPGYEKEASFSLGPDPDLETSALASSGGHVHLDMVGSADKVALLYSQENAPPRATPQNRLLVYSLAGQRPEKTASLPLEGRVVGLGASPDLAEIFLATSRGITTYNPQGEVIRQLARGLDNELAPNLFGEVYFDAQASRLAHWLPTHDPQLSPPAVQVIDTRTGENIGPAKGADDPRPALSPEGTLLAYRVSSDIDIFDVEARRRISILQGAARQKVRSLHFFPQGEILLVDQPDDFAVFYDVAPVGFSWNRGKVLARLPSKDLVDFRISPRGDVVAARSNDGEKILLFRVR